MHLTQYSSHLEKTPDYDQFDRFPATKLLAATYSMYDLNAHIAFLAGGSIYCIRLATTQEQQFRLTNIIVTN